MKSHRVRVVFQKTYLVDVKAKNIDAALHKAFITPIRLIEKEGVLESAGTTYAEETKPSWKP